MDKVIVYGLGKMFWDNYDKISARYEVVGYCDKDKMKLENSLNNAVMIDINELKEIIRMRLYINNKYKISYGYYHGFDNKLWNWERKTRRNIIRSFLE